MPVFAEERTEPATPKRKEEARKRGNVAKTRELSSALLILTSGIVFFIYGSRFAELLMNSFYKYWLFVEVYPSDINGVIKIFASVIKYILILTAPFFISAVFVSILSNIAQFGFIFSFDPIIPDLSRINPAEGIKRLFSLNSVVEFLKSVIKFLIIGFICYKVIASEMSSLNSLTSFSSMLFWLSRLSLKVILYSGISLLFISLGDYLFQRYQYEKNLRMTKQEVKEEIKEREGDPRVKARLRSLQRKLAMGRMMKEVPKSDVVITNPTKIAVALRYDRKTMAAPKVVAKGYGFIAEKIKEIARRFGVPIIENRELARLLIRVEIGSYIPTRLYRAVAEILAYVYQLRGKLNEVA